MTEWASVSECVSCRFRFLVMLACFFSRSQFDSVCSIDKIPMNRNERWLTWGERRGCCEEKMYTPFCLSLRAMSFDLCFYLLCFLYIYQHRGMAWQCHAEPYQIGKQYGIFINELSRHRVFYMRIDLFSLTSLLLCLSVSVCLWRRVLSASFCSRVCLFK